MIAREKVIRGLECCMVGDGHSPKCEICPYATVGDDTCQTMDALFSDALALLKAQEPRVMAYDELASFDGAFLIESSSISQLDWVFFFDVDSKSDAIWVEDFDGERYVVYREDYGTYTRCWTSRPDEKRRVETPWGS